MSESTIGRYLQMGLNFVGISPEAPCPLAQKSFWIVSMTTTQIFQYWYVVLSLGTGDLLDLVDSMSTTMPYTLLYLKLITFWLNRSSFHEILKTMDRDWRRHSPIESDPMRRAANLSNRASNLIMAISSGSVVAYGAGVLAGQEPNERNLLLKMKLPFDHGASPIYELVVLVQFLHQFAAAYSVGVLTAFLVTIIIHIGGQIDITCERLAELTAKNGRDSIKQLIERHQEIIRFARRIEQLYTNIALMQTLSNTVIICCLGFLIMISLGKEDSVPIIVKCLLFYVTINLEVFLFSFAGEYLSSKSRTIGDAAYESVWYELEPQDSRTFLFLILRCQKSLGISVGRVTNLALDNFTTIVKASGSYMSVLLAMY